MTSSQESVPGATTTVMYTELDIFTTDMMNLIGPEGDTSSCAELVTEGWSEVNVIINDTCYSPFFPIDVFNCLRPCAGVRMEIFVPESPRISAIHLLSVCGGTYEALLSGTGKQFKVHSHAGKGCIPYPTPDSDTDCEVTVTMPVSAVRMLVITHQGHDIDSGNGCEGDALYFYLASDPTTDLGPCSNEEQHVGDPIHVDGTLKIVFKRRPSYNPGSKNSGFTLGIYAYETRRR